MDPNFKPGDFIVGTYSENGKQIKAGKINGDPEDIEDMQQMLAEHGARSGGKAIQKTVIAKKGKKGKTKKIVEEEPVRTIWQQSEEDNEVVPERPTQPINSSIRKKYIYLYNKLGKIKLSIESLLECEQAYCVVFRTEDDLIFVPNAGETLTMITPDGEEVSVYYANSLFTWIDQTKQLMVLFKSDE